MISVITLNWNTTDMLIRLYKSAKDLAKNDFNFFIVDNGSRNEEFNNLRKFFENKDKVLIIRNSKNLGFSAGNNDVCKNLYRYEVDIGHVFFINSDIIIVEKAWDLKMCEILDQTHLNVGIVGCAYHPLRWDSNGNFHILPIVDHLVESESVQGAFFGINKKLFYELMSEDGFIFDENFKYAQYEETDLCFRIRKKGYSIYWIPINHIHDHHHSSVKKNGYHLNDEIKNINDFKKNTEKNKQLLIEKHKDFLLKD